jgi:hypothetical protein
VLDRQYGKIVFECDSCNEVLRTDMRDFDDALAIMKGKESKAQKIGDLWIHACPNCEIDR